MSTKIIHISDEFRENLELPVDGPCYELAIALHRGLGWPLVGLLDKSSVNQKWRHAAVKTPESGLWDARGLITEKEFGKPFPEIDSPYVIMDISEDDLRSIRPVREIAIEIIAKIAEALWPELPWINGQQKRYKEFADALEALSRKYDLWIGGPVPGCPPALFDGRGDNLEKGYALEQTADGLGFRIDRYFDNM
ncbi:MAG: hypothetical protein WC229_02430 [Candidatus Paceibacterota bacterium]|jgi:hypothetical protein